MRVDCGPRPAADRPGPRSAARPWRRRPAAAGSHRPSIEEARMRARTTSVLAAVVLAVVTTVTAGAEERPTVTISVFQPPSLGAFLPPIIKARALDAKNGVTIEFVEKPSGTYNLDFAAGTDKVGGSAALLSEALRVNKGVRVSCLFNVFDYWGTVVTASPAIKTLKDLEGKTLAADKVTTNYAMFLYFAKKAGVDIDRVRVQSATSPALVAMAQADRADAVQLTEPAFTKLTRSSPGKFREIGYVQKWVEYTGQKASPYLGVAAHEDWIAAHRDLVPKIYAAYRDAAQFTRANPAEAARLVGEKMKIAPADLEELIREPRLGLNVYPSSRERAAMEVVFRAAQEIRYIDRIPASSIVFDGLR
jgi:NitT/TauT family transport system substrate-binding protein